MHSLAILLTLFQSDRAVLPKRNLMRFLRQLEAEGLPVFVGEVAGGDVAWFLPEAPNVVRWRVEVGQEMWRKENVINLLEKVVPAEYTALAWIDADVWFQRLDWYEAACEALERHAVVQLADTIILTAEDGTLGSAHVTSGATGELVHGGTHPGMAWAARRSLWTEAGGLYERGIIGGGDTVNAACFLPGGGDLKWLGYSDLPEALAARKAWAERNGGCGHVPGTVWHEWHGDRRDRHYSERHKWLEGLDVQKHLCKREDGLLEWTDDAPVAVREAVRRYFSLRREDGRTPASQ